MLTRDLFAVTNVLVQLSSLVHLLLLIIEDKHHQTTFLVAHIIACYDEVLYICIFYLLKHIRLDKASSRKNLKKVDNVHNIRAKILLQNFRVFCALTGVNARRG